MTLPASSASPLPDPELAALIVENAVEYAIFTMAPNGRITSWSAGAERILGYGAAEAVGLNASVLFTEPDQAVGVDRLEIEKALATGRAEDSRWHVRRDGSRFWANGVTMRFERHGSPALLKIMRDETPSKLADEQRVLLLNELNHRVKNTLATVQSIAEQTLRGAGVDRATRQALGDRLMALSEAHNVLLQENWAGADLATILEQTCAPHEGRESERFRLDGPPVRLSPQQAVSISLVLHELATNALKYGALSVAAGHVEITWNIAQDGGGGRHLTLLWREVGGPPVAEPTREGFGTRLLKRSFGHDSSGDATLAFDPAGLRCVIALELSSAAEFPIFDPTRPTRSQGGSRLKPGQRRRHRDA